MTRYLPVLFCIALAFVGVHSNANAQEEQERSSFIEFVEGQLSAPNRQIRLNGLQGTLSSNVSFESITISDEHGTWLVIEAPQLIWNRTALFRGRLEVENLKAERIDFKRRPVADESLPNPEAGSLSIPELPVAVVFKQLDVPVLAFGPSVFGLATETSVRGNMVLDEGSLDLNFDVQRLDGSGGSLSAMIDFAAASKNLALDVTLEEPQNGVFATLADIEGRPPVSLRIQGDAPLEDLLISLAFDVAEQRILDGQLVVQGGSEGFVADAKLGGPLAEILSPQSRAFFGDNSDLTFRALFPTAGGIVVETARIDSGNVQLSANAAALSDGFFTALNVDLQLKPTGASRVTFPTEQGDLTIAGASLLVNYDVAKGERWDGNLEIEDLRNESIALSDVSLRSFGSVSNAENVANRAFTFDLEGRANGISATKAALSAALGNAITLSSSGSSSGSWSAGAPLLLKSLEITGDTFSAKADGQIADASFDGNIDLEANNLTAFSAITGRNLGGGAGLVMQGKIGFFNGQFNLAVDGNAQALSVDQAPLDRLLAGKTTIFGGVARTTDGLGFRNLNLSNDQLELDVNGSFASDFSDLNGTALIRDIAVLNENGAGATALQLRLEGAEKPFDLSAELSLQNGRLAKKTARDVSLKFDGTLNDDLLSGKLSSDGFLNEERLSISGDIAVEGEALSLTNLLADIGATNINGSFVRGQNGLIDAGLSVKSSDISSAASLMLVDASGSLDGDIRLTPTEDGGQSGNVTVNANDFVFGEATISTLALDAAIVDLFRKPNINADLTGNSIVVAGLNVKSVDAKIVTSNDVTDFELNSALEQSETRISATGRAVQNGSVSEVELKTFVLNSTIVDATLDRPASLQIGDGFTRISDALMRVGNGTVRIDGSAGETIDASLVIDALPLTIANTIRPDLDVGGQISGQVIILGPVDNPTADFQMTGSGLSAQPLNEAGITPLQLSANGSYVGQVITLASAALQNAQGIDLKANGRVPLSNDPLNINVSGTAPLSLVDVALRDRGARATGSAQLNVAVGGSLENPVSSGTISVTGGTFADPLSNARLNGIGLDASLSGQQISISRFRANLAAGGSVAATGTVGMSDQLPADLSVTLNQARYSDAQTFSTSLDGSLAITGNLLQSPLLSGEILLGTTEVTVPETFGAAATLLDVQHILPSRATRTTLDRLARASPVPTPTSRPSVLRLDVTVNAPNRVFVRGRGLDAELGGRVRLTGPVVDIVPIGQFELIRGRLSVVGKRIDLDEGTITLEGDLNPIIDFLARIEEDDIDAFIAINGRLTDLQVTLSSVPELPEDEVLSQIIFGRGVDELSPLQIARLATVALELTGGSSPSLINSLRSGVGLDDLDVVDDGDGNAAVRAGKYINDNVYLNLQAGQKTEATINLDITDSLRAKGSVSSEGDTSVGVFFERDY